MEGVGGGDLCGGFVGGDGNGGDGGVLVGIRLGGVRNGIRKIKNQNIPKQRGKTRSRALLDRIIVGSIGYRTYGRALLYLVYRQQVNKIKGATPPPPPPPFALCHY